jgi:tetratricopeptide (TPR) repeat protein
VAIVAAALLAVEGSVQALGAQAMRPRVGGKLSKAQTAIEEEQYDKALEELDSLKKMKDLTPYEKSLLYSLYGQVFAIQEKYGESLNAYETVLLQDDLTDHVQQTTLYTLAQLQLFVASRGDTAEARRGYEKVVDYLQRLLAATENPGPGPYFSLGQALYLLERHSEAIEPVRRAIAIAAERGQPAQENWYLMLRAIYFEQQDYPKLLEVLEILVTKFPSREYWIHLAEAYGEMGDAKRRLAAYDVAFEQGYLRTERDLLIFAQLLAQADIPYRAAVLVENGLKEGVVEGTARTWRFLSQVWSLAQEDARAIEALMEAAALSDDGELDARLAQSYAILGNWRRAEEAARNALRKGVRDAHEVQMTLGNALYEQERYEEAKSAFRAAQKSPDVRNRATEWIIYIEREEERLRQLQRSLE